MDVTKLYHHCEGESHSFCEWHAQNPIDIGWERLFEDNFRDNDNAATCAETNEESMFIVDEELITVMDSIVEEHKCKNKACNVVTAVADLGGFQGFHGTPLLASVVIVMEAWPSTKPNC